MLVFFTNWPWYFVGILLELIDLITNDFPILEYHFLKYPMKYRIYSNVGFLHQLAMVFCWYFIGYLKVFQ